LHLETKSVIEEFIKITFIIQKLQEIEKLKIVLFNEEQIALFSLITNALKSLDEEKITITE
jgi:hypothetical protein